MATRDLVLNEDWLREVQQTKPYSAELDKILRDPPEIWPSWRRSIGKQHESREG